MPVFAVLDQCKIQLFAADHPPPHFHVRANDGSRALVAIADGRIIKGRLPRTAEREMRAFWRDRQTALAAEWSRLNARDA